MKKLKLKQLALLLGGAAATSAASQMGVTAHASTRTVKVEVKKGDTAWQIAKDHKASLKQIVKDNKLKDNGNTIYVGQKLNVEESDQFKADLDSKKTTKTNKKTNVSSVKATRTASTPTITQASRVQQPSTQVATQTAQRTPARSAVNYTSNAVGSEKAAKEWIAGRESSGSYTAQNGQYYGRYQLSLSYLHGDLSAANQERVADNYVKSRYGSWTGAQQFWQAHGWY